MDNTHSGGMAGRTVLVTGGTGGIGKATAIGLATMGARVGIIGISSPGSASANIVLCRAVLRRRVA